MGRLDRQENPTAPQPATPESLPNGHSGCGSPLSMSCISWPQKGLCSRETGRGGGSMRFSTDWVEWGPKGTRTGRARRRRGTPNEGGACESIRPGMMYGVYENLLSHLVIGVPPPLKPPGSPLALGGLRWTTTVWVGGSTYGIIVEGGRRGGDESCEFEGAYRRL